MNWSLAASTEDNPHPRASRDEGAAEEGRAGAPGVRATGGASAEARGNEFGPRPLYWARAELVAGYLTVVVMTGDRPPVCWVVGAR